MATLPRKPDASAAATATPVGGTRARELQERIRVLRGMAEEARARLAQANDRNRHQLQAELEHAERACRQAERQMVELRARAHAAGPVPAASHDPKHPSQELPPEALLRIVKPTEAVKRPVGQVRELDTGNADLDLLWNRNETARNALDLLQRASEPQFDAPGIHTELPLGTAPDSGLKTDIDFGPLLEDFSPADGGPARDTPPSRSTGLDFGPLVDEPEPAAAPVKSAPAPAAMPTPRPKPRPQQNRQPPATPTTRATAPGHARAVPAGEPIRPRQPALTASPKRRGRRIFRPALLAGLLLGIALVVVLIRLGPDLAGLTGPVPAQPAAAPDRQTTTVNRSPDAAWRRTLLRQEQSIRQAAHARFLALRDRLRRQAGATPPAVAPVAAETVSVTPEPTASAHTPPVQEAESPLSLAPAPAGMPEMMGPPPPPGELGPVQVLF